MCIRDSCGEAVVFPHGAPAHFMTMVKQQGALPVSYTHLPYGYIKDPNNPKHWVIDEEAAQVVRRIFDMTLEGFGTCLLYTSVNSELTMTHYFS